MRRSPDEAVPDDLRPCPEFQMSARFKDWLMARMRDDVLGQVQAAGLDRMALLRRASSGDAAASAADAAAGTPAAGPAAP